MMRILKFAGVFLGTLVLIVLLVFGFNFSALTTLFHNREGIKEGAQWVQKTYSLKGLTEYVGAQPERVSIASFSMKNPDSSLVYNTHTPRTMGRLSNLFLVIEYALEVENGDLDPNQQIRYATINRYQLPYMDASHHDDALSKLHEWQAKNDSTVALKYLVDAAVAYNDIAISDYLLFKIGAQNIDKLLDQLSIEETESPLPFCGIYIALNPHIDHQSPQAHFDSLSQFSRDKFSDIVFRKAKRFANDPSFHKQIIKMFKENEGLGIQFTKQRDALAFFPKTTAHDMAGLMKKIQQETLISKAVSKRIKSILEWPLGTNERLQKDFKYYGAMYDNRMGMVNGIDFGASTYSGEPFVQAVFFDNLQVAFWFHMSSNLMHQDFEQRLIWDPALRVATAEQISGKAPKEGS